MIEVKTFSFNLRSLTKLFTFYLFYTVFKHSPSIFLGSKVIGQTSIVINIRIIFNTGMQINDSSIGKC